jgi:hypothetical protein
MPRPCHAGQAPATTDPQMPQMAPHLDLSCLAGIAWDRHWLGNPQITQISQIDRAIRLATSHRKAL